MIKAGTIFDTPFESGCEAMNPPDEYGNFDALDSDRILCSFNIVMVEKVQENTE